MQSPVVRPVEKAKWWSMSLNCDGLTQVIGYKMAAIYGHNHRKRSCRIIMNQLSDGGSNPPQSTFKENRP